MSQNKKRSIIPKGFLWRLTFLNIVVIAVAIGLSGYAIYNTACFLVEGMGTLPAQRQKQFNATLYQYLLIFTMLGVLVSSVLHFYFTKKLVSPIKQLIEATKVLKKGYYPKEIKVNSNDEVGQLVMHYNDLTNKLEEHDVQREKIITNLSHELRTPVANLNGYLHALKSGVIKGDVELYSSLYDEVGRLTNMIEQIDHIETMSSRKKEKMPFESMRIDDVIKQSLAMFEWRLIEREIKVELALDKCVCVIHKEGIQQMMSNLIDNAIKYNFEKELIVIKGVIKGDSYEISVSGQSGELSQLDKERLFDRFYRVDPSRNRMTGGTGLGLSIVRDIVLYHGGHVEVVSENKINTFKMTLPINLIDE